MKKKIKQEEELFCKNCCNKVEWLDYNGNCTWCNEYLEYNGYSINSRKTNYPFCKFRK